jgi:HK97 family phage prohead protease
MTQLDRLRYLIATGMAAPRDLESAGADAVLEAKSGGEFAWFRSTTPTVLSADDDSREISYVYSDETQDRYGDRIRVKGWRLDNYKANPVALWQHDMDQPIGVSREVKTVLGDSPRLIGTIKYADPGTSAFHDATYLLAKQGILKAVSVGFDPLEMYRPKGAEERNELGLGQYGVDIRGADLLEISLVSIPANPNAMQLALEPLFKSGELDERFRKEITDPLTERDWANRSREIRRRSVVVESAEPVVEPTEARPEWAGELINEVRDLRRLVTDLRGSGGVKRPDADSPDARVSTGEALKAMEAFALKRRLEQLTKEATTTLEVNK